MDLFISEIAFLKDEIVYLREDGKQEKTNFITGKFIISECFYKK